MFEGVAPLEDHPCMLRGLDDYVELLRELSG
jgi:hypothetical protein